MTYSNFYARFYGWIQQTASALTALWRLRPSRFYLLVFGLLQALAWWQAIFIFRHLSGNVLVLHYNVDFGIDLVGDPSQIFIYPLAALGVFIINYLTAAATSRHRDFPIFSHLLLAGGVIFGLGLNLALLFIYLINFK